MGLKGEKKVLRWVLGLTVKAKSLTLNAESLGLARLKGRCVVSGFAPGDAET
jgi:hypothetical protein